MKVETLFLDAGGVLVNPNFERVADALRAHGVPAEGAALRRAEAYAKKELDTGTSVNATNDASRGWLVHARFGALGRRPRPRRCTSATSTTWTCLARAQPGSRRGGSTWRASYPEADCPRVGSLAELADRLG